MYQRIGGFTARLIPQPAGDTGTRMTLGTMQALATSGSRDPEVRSAAIAALDRSGVPDHNPAAALAALFAFVRDQIRFVPDPVGVQGAFSPRYVIESGGGNCVQKAILLAALAQSIGIPVARFRAIAANPLFPQSFSHVYVVARVGGRDVALDPTYRTNRPGFEYPGRTRIGDFRL